MHDWANSKKREVFHDNFEGSGTEFQHDLLIMDEESEYYLKDHPTKKGVGSNSEVKNTKSVLQILFEDIFDSVIE